MLVMAVVVSVTTPYTYAAPASVAVLLASGEPIMTRPASKPVLVPKLSPAATSLAASASSSAKPEPGFPKRYALPALAPAGGLAKGAPMAASGPESETLEPKRSPAAPSLAVSEPFRAHDVPVR